MTEPVENQSKFNFVNLKPTINPVENISFAGMTLKTTSSEFERIKKFILEETNTRLIFQTRSEHYLKIVPANPTATEQ